MKRTNVIRKKSPPINKRAINNISDEKLDNTVFKLISRDFSNNRDKVVIVEIFVMIDRFR